MAKPTTAAQALSQIEKLKRALTLVDESLYAERVLRAGGRGYIMKQEGTKN